MNRAVRIAFNIFIGVLVTVAAVVVVLSFAGTILLQQSIDKQQRVLTCQVAYDDAFREALTIRDRAVVAVVDAAAAGKETGPALLKYRQVIRENPLPPHDFCDTVR